MNELDYLGKIWGEIPATDSTQTIAKLKKLDFFQKRINRLKVVAIILILSSLIFTLNFLSNITLEVYIGVSIIIASTAIFIGYYLKNQFYTSKLDYGVESARFAQQAITMLRKQNRIFGLPFLMFILFMIAGANIMFLGMIPDSAITPDSESVPANPLYFHIIFSVLIALSGFLGLLVRRWRIRREVNPLIEELSRFEME
jgi:hypothetical protein